MFFEPEISAARGKHLQEFSLCRFPFVSLSLSLSRSLSLSLRLSVSLCAQWIVCDLFAQCAQCAQVICELSVPLCAQVICEHICVLSVLSVSLCFSLSLSLRVSSAT